MKQSLCTETFFWRFVEVVQGPEIPSFSNFPVISCVSTQNKQQLQLVGAPGFCTFLNSSVPEYNRLKILFHLSLGVERIAPLFSASRDSTGVFLIFLLHYHPRAVATALPLVGSIITNTIIFGYTMVPVVP